MYEICKNMLETIMKIEDYNNVEELQNLFSKLITEFAWTINCPSDWRDIKEKLQEEYKDNNFALDIIGY